MIHTQKSNFLTNGGMMLWVNSVLNKIINFAVQTPILLINLPHSDVKSFPLIPLLYLDQGTLSQNFKKTAIIFKGSDKICFLNFAIFYSEKKSLCLK